MKYTAMSLSSFVDKAISKHHNRWIYDDTVYVGTNDLVTIICPKHGSFRQTPKQHLKGYHNCIQCKLNDKRDKFIYEADRLYSGRYDYSLVQWKTMNTSIIVVCPDHGEFNVLPVTHLRRNSSCSKCKNITTEMIIERARLQHGDRYNYSNVDYVPGDNKIPICCATHGVFQQNVYGHISGQGCPKCKSDLQRARKLSNLPTFLQRATDVHGNKYDYSDVVYVNSHTKVKILCHDHGEFSQTPNNHTSRGIGCPQCGMTGRYDINRLQTDTKLGESGGVLYLCYMKSAEESFYKIGITKSLKHRIKGFTGYESSVVCSVDNLTLLQAYLLEQNILKQHHRYTPTIKFGGYTECLDMNEYEVRSLIEMMDVIKTSSVVDVTLL